VLVQSGQMTREEALAEYALPAYKPEQLESDKQFVIKKLGMSEDEFNKYIAAPAKSHYDYKNIDAYWQRYFKLVKRFKFLKFW
jgi:hypothetical protein